MTAHEELSIESLKQGVSTAILLKRRTLRLIESTRFTTMFAELDVSNQKLVEELIKKDDLNSIEAWIRKRRHDEYGCMPMRQLRLVGQRLGVPHYHCLSKAILLSEIHRYEKVVESSQVSSGTPY